MLRLTRRSFLVLATLVLFAGFAMASPGRGGSSGGKGGGCGGGGSGSSARFASGGSSKSTAFSVHGAKTVNTKVTPGKYTYSIPDRTVNTKTTQVINTKVSMVINTKISQVITTKVIIPQVITTHCCHCINPQVVVCLPRIGFFGACGVVEVPAIPVQYERWLRLHNDTNEKLTVFLRYHTQDVTGQWDWIPEEPSPLATKWLAFELQPGEVLEPKFGELPIPANRIRIYAESMSRKWSNYRDEDFWLVPEVTPEGEHLYYSPVRQTFDFYINGSKQ